MSDDSDDKNLPARRIDTTVTTNLPVGIGGMAPENMTQVMEFAKLMAIAGLAIPPHLRNNQGACLAIAIQAFEWGMSPFAVASKSYETNGRLAFEAQLIAAVILRRAPIVGLFNYEWQGEVKGTRQIKMKRRDGEHLVTITDGTLRCTVSAEVRDRPGLFKEYTSPAIGQIETQNSPLWRADPQQQIGYYSVRAFCRRHFPHVLMGIYDRDELDDGNEVIALTSRRRRPSMTERLQTIAQGKVAEQPAAANNETGEVLDVVAPKIDESPEAEWAGVKEERQAEPGKKTKPKDEPEVKDAETAAKLEEGKAMAAQGIAQYKKWLGRLSTKQFDMVRPHLDWLEKHAERGNEQ